MQEERECERLKYYIFVYNPMNNKCSKDGKSFKFTYPDGA